MLSAAKEQIIADLRHRLQCAVVCMQETHRRPEDIRPSIPGMDLAIERPHSQYGSAIFVTSGTIVNTTSLTDINNIYILRVDLTTFVISYIAPPHISRTVACRMERTRQTTVPARLQTPTVPSPTIYKPPGGRFSFHQPRTAVGDQQQVFSGDFNSHSSTWGYATTNTAGELVEDWADNQRLSLIHDPKLPSSFNSGRWWRGTLTPSLLPTELQGAATRCDRTNTTLPTSTHWSASECSYHRSNRTFQASIQPEEGKLGAVRISARCSRGEHPRHSRML